MNTQNRDDNRPVEVEIVRPMTVGGALGYIFTSIVALALIAWGFDALIAQLFPGFEITYWQMVAAIVLLRSLLSRELQPRTVVR